jgi:hypothetical protein
VSTGIGSILVSGIYEAGRPQRLNPEEAMKLEEQWQDFGETLAHTNNESNHTLLYSLYALGALHAAWPHLLIMRYTHTPK